VGRFFETQCGLNCADMPSRIYLLAQWWSAWASRTKVTQVNYKNNTYMEVSDCTGAWSGAYLERGDDADDEDSWQEQRVTDLEWDEKQRCRRAWLVAPETDHRQRVASEAEQTQRAHQNRLHHEVVDAARRRVERPRQLTQTAHWSTAAVC